jgi:hypothetical protein
MDSNRLLVWGEETSSLVATPRLQEILSDSCIAAGLIFIAIYVGDALVAAKK